MKTLKVLAIGSLLAFALSACGDDAGDWKGKYQKIVDEACACKDDACFEKARDKRKKLRKDFKEKFKDNKEEGMKIGKQMAPLDKKFNECGDKLRQANKPADKPAAKAPTPEPPKAPTPEPAKAPEPAKPEAK